MIKPDINKVVNVILIALGVFYVTHCGKDSVIVQKGYTDKEMEYALEVQKESILREIDKQKEDEAFKNIDSVDVILRDSSNRTNSRQEAFK